MSNRAMVLVLVVSWTGGAAEKNTHKGRIWRDLQKGKSEGKQAGEIHPLGRRNGETKGKT
jgi:hypothetical protein